MNDERRVLLGRIVGVHGVHGAVKLESWTEPRLAIFGYSPWLLERQGKLEERADVRGHVQGKGLVAELPGMVDRDAAAALVGSEIWVARAALPALGPDEFYQTDLEGLQVVNVKGAALGRVSHLFGNGAHDVLVTRDEAGRQHLIPWVRGRYVKAVDLDARRITVDWDQDD